MTEDNKAKVPAWAAGVGHKADMNNAAELSKRVPFRFWLKQGTERKILFLTDGDEAPVIEEHQYQAMKRGRPSWDNYLTCLKLLGETCPMCAFSKDVDKFHASKVQLFTILDLTPWKNKDGQEQAFTKKVLAVKRRTQEIIARKYISRLDEGQTLKGASFKVFRSNDSKSPSAGTEYDFINMVDLSTLPEGAADPVDWELFAPDRKLMEEEVQRLRVSHGLAPASMPSSTSVSFTDAVNTSTTSQVTRGPVDDLGISDSVEIDY